MGFLVVAEVMDYSSRKEPKEPVGEKSPNDSFQGLHQGGNRSAKIDYSSTEGQ